MAAARLLAFLGRPFVAYNAALERQPLLTKSATSGIMYAAGDAIAQYGEHYHANAALPVERRAAFAFDYRRLGVFLVWGGVVAGPLYTVWFGFLDNLPVTLYRLRQNRNRLQILRAYATLKRAGIDVKFSESQIPDAARFSKYSEKVVKIAADQLIFSSLYTLAFFVGIGMGNGAVERWVAERRALAFDEVQHELEDKLKLKLTKPDLQLEKDLLRLKSRLQGGGGGREEAAAIERLLGVLEEQRKAKLTLVPSWPDIWHSTWAHTREVYWPTYFADCLVWPFLQGAAAPRARPRACAAHPCRCACARGGRVHAHRPPPPPPLPAPLRALQPSTSRTYRCGTRCST